MRRVFEVKYDFSAQETSELTVRKGDMLVECAQDAPAANGWIYVELQLDSSKKGFVPYSFIEEVSKPITPPRMQEASTPLRRTTLESSPRRVSPRRSPAATRSMYYSAVSQPSTRLADYATSSPSWSPSRTVNRHEMTFTGSSTMPPPGGLRQTTMPAMPSHQPVSDADNKLKRLEESIADILSEVRSAQEQNAQIVQRATELENLIADERRNWRDVAGVSSM
ncbi:Variant SH3 domain [Carpediemonas membranifera]|uniref:Variant SH3 domain n=1 Tax=Carpediemonas membranifera TaxID=201153 RepID=A0A8J6ATZ8_9EUKA|nr:Variant SH3 domain [Carpediemonas membranifera]|eukprot:KAG9391455.1 Variant SH3 domain [Carpediemonas membranifera]